MGFAAVNCSQILPSGNNLWERFKLKREIRPTIFGTAPWMKVKQAEVHHMKDLESLKKFVDTRMVPKGTEITTDKDLRKFCGFDKNIVRDMNSVGDTCLVLVKGARFTKVQADLEQKLVLKYRRVKIATIDGSKVRLSMENSQDYPTDQFALRLHALRNGTHYLSMVNPPTWDYTNTFVAQAIGNPLYGYNDAEGIRLIKSTTAERQKARKDKASGKKQSPKKDPPSTKKPDTMPNKDDSSSGSSDRDSSSSSSGSGSGESAAPQEISEAERVRRERLRRDEMERQEREHLFGYGSGKDEEEETTEAVEDMEEDIIEL